VTDSDSILLLLLSAFSAYVFVNTVLVAIVPFAAAIFGITFAVLRKVERLLPRHVQGARFLNKMVKSLNVIDSIVASEGDSPPVTKRRRRPPQNFIDFLWYEQNRLTRDFSHYFSSTQGTLQNMFTVPLKVVIVLRIFCMLFSAGLWIRWALTPFCPELLERQTKWFAADTHHHEVSDQLLHFALKQLFNIVQSALGGIIGVIDVGELISPLRYVAFPVAILVLVFLRYQYETWLFNNIYEESGKAMKCECKCKCDLLGRAPHENEHLWMKIADKIDSVLGGTEAAQEQKEKTS
jgi:hypothetical protein